MRNNLPPIGSRPAAPKPTPKTTEDDMREKLAMLVCMICDEKKDKSPEMLTALAKLAKAAGRHN